MSISSNEIVKLENKPNKGRGEEVRDKTAKIKMQPNKINLMIESDRQKNSAPIAKRVSGDGAFCLFNSFILQGVPLVAERQGSRKSASTASDFLGQQASPLVYIRAHPALIYQKK